MGTTDLSSISFSSWAGIAAAAAVIGTCWRTIAVWVTRLFDVVIGRVILKEEAARAVMAHVWRQGLKNPIGLVCYGGITTHVAPKQRVEVVPYEGIVSEPRLIWFGKVPVLVQSGLTSGQFDTLNIGNQSGSAMPVLLRFIRGTLDVDTFVKDAVAEYNRLRQAQSDAATAAEDSTPKRFNVVRMHGSGGYGSLVGNGREGARDKKSSSSTPGGAYDPEEVLRQLQRSELRLLDPLIPADLIPKPAPGTKPFGQHPVSESIMEQFTEVGSWLRSEQWFRSRGISWSRGYLLYGPSGSGKSTIVRNVALQHDLPIYSFDLSSYDNDDFIEDWKTVMQNAPAIALLEDFDCVFSGRQNLAVKDKNRDGLTFDCLLNTVSGVGSSDGVLLFVTTNHLESLDPALGVPDPTDSTRSTRPGRINRAIYIGPMAEPERRRLAHIILDQEAPEVIDAVVAAGEGEMAAQFQDRCARLALQKGRWMNAATSIPVSPSLTPFTQL